jgi:hypothetical protein
VQRKAWKRPAFCFQARRPAKILEEIPMSRKTAYCSVLPVLVCWASLIVPASAQHFQQVTGSLVSVSAGRAEVFGYDAEGAVWRYAPGTKSFAKIANAFLVDIAVGGGTDSQPDAVWGVNSSDSVYKFNFVTKAFDAIPGVLTQISVGVGNQDNCHPYEVWGVNPVGSVFRYSYCTKKFLQVTGVLSHVATSGGDVWGINGSGSIFHYNFGTHSFVSVPGTLTQIAVGVNDVWGVNGSEDVFRYDVNSGTFVSVGGNTAQVAAGGDGVWLIDTSTHILRFDSSTESFVQVQGNLKGISVGSGAGVFGTNDLNDDFTFVRP